MCENKVGSFLCNAKPKCVAGFSPDAHGNCVGKEQQPPLPQGMMVQWWRTTLPPLRSTIAGTFTVTSLLHAKLTGGQESEYCKYDAVGELEVKGRGNAN